MSIIQEKLCFKILIEYFGKIVADVGRVIMKKGINTFSYIVSNTQLPKNKVQEALCVLIKHNLVIWDEVRPAIPGYTILNDRILLFLRFPRYVVLCHKYGEDAEMVVDILWKEGQATASQIIIFSGLKLLDAAQRGPQTLKADVEDIHIVVRNAFERLVKSHYIQRCPNPQDPEKAVPVMTVNEEDLYRFPAELLDLKLLQDEIRSKHSNPDHTLVSQASKTTHTHPDKDIFWRLNYDTFHIELRDSLLQNSLTTRIDAKAGACFATVLKVSYQRADHWVPTFEPVLATDIRDQHKGDVTHLDQYLKILVENGGDCLRKVGDAGGGEYVASIASLIRSITLSHIDSIVQERFGSKAARIFRLVRENGMMEQDHIAEVSMVGKKEANVLTHQLLNDSFLRLYEVRKGISPSPASKSIYLFHVELVLLVRMLLEWTYKALYNLMVQRETKYLQNKRLLERKARVEMIVANLEESGGSKEQIQEVEEIFSPTERETVKNVIDTQDKLLDFEIELDESIFLLEMFLYYETHKS